MEEWNMEGGKERDVKRGGHEMWRRRGIYDEGRQASCTRGNHLVITFPKVLNQDRPSISYLTRAHFLVRESDNTAPSDLSRLSASHRFTLIAFLYLYP